jgi:hypothetical protein
MSFSRSLPLFFEIPERIILNECTIEMQIHQWKNYFKIPIRKRIRGEWIFSHIMATHFLFGCLIVFFYGRV